MGSWRKLGPFWFLRACGRIGYALVLQTRLSGFKAHQCPPGKFSTSFAKVDIWGVGSICTALAQGEQPVNVYVDSRVEAHQSGCREHWRGMADSCQAPAASGG